MKSVLLRFKLCILALPVFLVTANLHAQIPQPLEVGHAERLLILAPHPDDETLGAAGLIQQVLANGGSVRSVVVTAGDAYVEAIQQDLHKLKLSRKDFVNYGEKRLNESRAAAKLLGKGKIRLDLYGFSDGSIYSMLVTHWQRNKPDKSGFTGFDHVPYREAEDRGIAQDGQDMRTELLEILKDSKPTLIAFPDVMENDSDHAGLGMFALLAINDWLEHERPGHPDPRLLAYLIHWQNGWPPGSTSDKPVDAATVPLYLPDDLPLRGHIRTCLDLTPEEAALKGRALKLYKTQERAMGAFLTAFVHSNECFTQLKAADSDGIENVVKQWQHARKSFDLHPVSRVKI